MLGFAPLSADPLAAIGEAGGISYSAAVIETARALAVASASAGFATTTSAAASATDTVSSTAAIAVAVNNNAEASSTNHHQVDFAAQVQETAAGNMSTTVLPSIFGAIVAEEALGEDSLLLTVVFFATITDGASAADQIFARLLWELIDDAQTVTWNNINNSQADTWSAVNTSQIDAWQIVQTQT